MPEIVDLVIGGASGMGAAAARLLKGERRLLVVDRSFEAAAAVAGPLGAEAVACDISDPVALAELAAQVPRVGSMIVTAGINQGPGRRILEVNLIGLARLLEAFDASIGEGSAVALFSSMVDLFPATPEVVSVLSEPLRPDFFERLDAAGGVIEPAGAAYVLSKIGVVRLVRANAQRLWQRGARIVSVTPGVIDTPMMASSKGNEGMEQMTASVGRLGHPEEVAAVAAFLVSDGASFVNGINVNVDGGLVVMTQEATPATAARNV